MAATGRLAASDLMWTDGMSEWKRASAALPELFSAGPATPAAPPPPPVVAASPIHPSYAPTPPAGAVDPMYPTGTPISAYLWQSIVVTLFCCMPLGIPAVVYASRVEVKRFHGDIAGAMSDSKNAKLWCLLSLLIGLPLDVISIGAAVLQVMDTLKHTHF